MRPDLARRWPDPAPSWQRRPPPLSQRRRIPDGRGEECQIRVVPRRTRVDAQIRVGKNILDSRVPVTQLDTRELLEAEIIGMQEQLAGFILDEVLAEDGKFNIIHALPPQD